MCKYKYIFELYKENGWKKYFFLHNVIVFVQHWMLFLPKYLRKWIKICSFATDFETECIYKPI